MASAPAPAAGASTGVSVQNVDIRVPKGQNKKLAIMRFHNSMAVDFTKWSQPKMERENNKIQFKGFNEEMPKFGAGSEYGREAREEARRKKYGIISKKYKPEDQPWVLQTGGKTTNKKYRGVREGGVSENASYYVLTQAADGAFEAFPVQEWYNFQSVQSYKPLSYEEAEEEFTSRNRTFNLFNVMVRNRMKKNEDGDDEEGEEGEEGKSKGKKKKKGKGDSRYGDDMDEMMDSSGESSDEDDNDDEDDEGKKPNKKKGKKGAKPKKKRKNGSDEEPMEDSDDGDGEGRELDYISSSSDAGSDLDQTKDDLKGVAEEDGLRKLLNSDEEDDEEENNDENKDKDEVEEEENDEGPKEGGSKDDKNEKKKKKKKKKDGKKPRKEDYGSSSSSGSDGDSSASELEKAKPSPKTKPSSANSSRSATPTKPGSSIGEPSSDSKRKSVPAPEPSTSQAAKRPRIDMPSSAPSSSSAASQSASSSLNDGVNEESVRRYLQRKPMTTTELLQKFKSKKTGLSSDQLVHHIAQILKKINPVKQMIKGKMYLSIKA